MDTKYNSTSSLEKFLLTHSRVFKLLSVPSKGRSIFFIFTPSYLLFIASDIATETATLAPTIGLFPIPINPIIST